MRYAAGQDLNLLERSRSITPSPAADALFSIVRLYDGYADGIFRFGSSTANPSITVDLAMLDAAGVDGGDFAAWPSGLPTGWAVTATGGGTVVQSSPGRGGAGSEAKLNKGAGVASLLKTYRVRAGERLTIDLWTKIGAAGVSKAQLYNPATKMYLTGAGVWQAAQVYLFSEAASTSYVEKTLAFQVESFNACQGGTAYLELTLADLGAGGGSDFSYFDDVYLWPTWNAIVVVGHNIDPGMAATLRSSTDGFSGSDVQEAVLTLTRPACYAYLSTPSAKRYARLLLTGTQSAQAGAAYAGELAVCYLESALTAQANGWEITFMDDQLRNTTRSGHTSVVPQQIDSRRVLRVSFDRTNDASYREGRDELMRRCRGGQWPAIVVPADTEPEVVHGRRDNSWRAVRNLRAYWQDDVVLTETPLPQVTS